MDQDESWYDDNAFVLQHDILRDLAIRQSSQEPVEERKRLFLDLIGNKLPNWWSQQNQPFIIKARLLSISTGNRFALSPIFFLYYSQFFKNPKQMNDHIQFT